MNSFNKKTPDDADRLAPRRGAVRPAISAAVCGLSLLLGCSTAPVKKPGAAVSSSSNAIQELNLLSMPMALNLDANPGADGIAVKLFANNEVDAKTVPIAEGKIEILLYDGVINAAIREMPPVLHVWTYAPRELKSFAFNKSVGTGYDLILSWGQDQPKKSNVTVIARHISGQGRTVFSGPVTITVSSF